MTWRKSEPDKFLNDDELKQKHLTEVREKIDRGLKQLDEGQGISAQEARARLRHSPCK
jgi:hypothetical protein